MALSRQVQSDSADAQDPVESFQEYPEKNTRLTSRRFNFDPNTATVDQLEQLGFKPYIARRIDKYRIAGGKFRVKSDLNKVFGIDQALVQKIWNDIELPEVIEKQAYNPSEKSPQPAKAKQLLDINTADTNSLIALPGIGSKLARRIVEFRNRLGGFYDLGQLKEVYGLKPETIEAILPQLRLDASAITLIDINQADAKTLDAHPYIDRNQANAIVAYRTQHGHFKSSSDLAKIVVMNELIVNKIKNYIKF